MTFWNFIAMGAATIGVIYFVGIKDFSGFLAMFLILFITTGIGNGSTYRMIPSIFREENLRESEGRGRGRPCARPEDSKHRERRRARIYRRDRRLRRLSDPARLRRIDRRDRRPASGVGVFAFYVVCLALTWWFYLRKSSVSPSAASLARSARVSWTAAAQSALSPRLA